MIDNLYVICNKCGNSWMTMKRNVSSRECSKCRSTNLTQITNEEFKKKILEEGRYRNLVYYHTIGHNPQTQEKTKAHPWSQGRRMAYEKKKERQRLEKEREVQEEQRRLREVREKTSKERREKERIEKLKADLKKNLISEGITEMWDNAKKHGMNDNEFIDYLVGPSFGKSREEAEIILELVK